MFPYSTGHFHEGLRVARTRSVQSLCGADEVLPNVPPVAAAEHGSEEGPHGLQGPADGLEVGQHG